MLTIVIIHEYIAYLDVFVKTLPCDQLSGYLEGTLLKKHSGGKSSWEIRNSCLRLEDNLSSFIVSCLFTDFWILFLSTSCITIISTKILTIY